MAAIAPTNLCAGAFSWWSRILFILWRNNNAVSIRKDFILYALCWDFNHGLARHRHSKRIFRVSMLKSTTEESMVAHFTDHVPKAAYDTLDKITSLCTRPFDSQLAITNRHNDVIPVTLSRYHSIFLWCYAVCTISVMRTLLTQPLTP